MTANAMVEWVPGTYLTTVLMIYLLLSVVLDRMEKQRASKKPFTDEDRIAKLAWQRGCSEFDIFSESTTNWNIPMSRVDNDFKSYVKYGRFPYYVKDYLRKHRSETEDSPPSPVIHPGGKLPPSWTA